jgi:flagellar biosynthetic protein FliR
MGMQWVGVMVFFALEGHHALLRGVAYSLERVPPGTPFFHYALDEVVRMFGLVFSLGVAVGAPVIAALLMLEAALAVVSKSLPQMNIYFVSLPIKIALGLGLLALATRQFAPLMGRGYLAVFGFWQKVLG